MDHGDTKNVDVCFTRLVNTLHKANFFSDRTE